MEFDALYASGARGVGIARAIGAPEFQGGSFLQGARARQELETQGREGSHTGHPAVEGFKEGVIRGEDGEILFTLVDEDDSALGGEPTLKTDLVGMLQKWGSRLRIRCRDEEIYYRLTGMHERVSFK